MTKKNVLVTGASNGFGLLTSKTLADKGHTVVATMRDPKGKNAEAARQLEEYSGLAKGTISVLELDVTQEDSVNRAVREAIQQVGKLDAVVNNAGIGSGGWTEGYTIDQWQAIFDVNVYGVQRVNRAVLPDMRERGEGLLIHVSSVIGRMVMPYATPYIASKFALEATAEAYNYELARFGVESIIVEPGAFPTNFAVGMMPPSDSRRIETYGEAASDPEQMWGGFMESMTGPNAPNPQDVADAVAVLIDAKRGERPLRTIVDPLMGGMGADAINATQAQAQKKLFESMG